MHMEKISAAARVWYCLSMFMLETSCMPINGKALPGTVHGVNLHSKAVTITNPSGTAQKHSVHADQCSVVRPNCCYQA